MHQDYLVILFIVILAMQKIVFLDTETGGLDWDENALLTIGYSVATSLYDVIKTREFKLPIKGTITESALNVNGLDVTNRSPDSTIEQVIETLKTDIGSSSEVALYGHNVFFDLNFIRSHDKKSYQELINLFNRNIVDTKSLWVQLITDYKYYGSTSMHKIMDNNEKHTAGGDTVLNAALMKKYSIINKKQ